MKFRVSFKCPDAVGDAVEEAAVDAVRDEFPGMNSDEREEITALRKERAMAWARQWFAYCEYVTVECDTEANTVVVIPKG